MINLVKSQASHLPIADVLPKQLLSSYRGLIKAVAQLDCQGQLLAMSGSISKNRLLVVAGQLIYLYQGLYSELGWSQSQVWAQSERGEFIVLTRVKNDYLLILTNPCLKGQVQSILNSLEKESGQANKKQFLQEIERQLCELVGPIGKVIIQNQANLNLHKNPEKLIEELVKVLRRYISNPQQIKEFQEQALQLL